VVKAERLIHRPSTIDTLFIPTSFNRCRSHCRYAPVFTLQHLLTSLWTFINNVYVGVDVDAQETRGRNDAVVVVTGAAWPRDLGNPRANGIHFAMEVCDISLTEIFKAILKFSSQVAVEQQGFARFRLASGNYIGAPDKDVTVIGGGDAGNDCIGTAMRRGAESVLNVELFPQPPPSLGSGNPSS
jgi:glutamate synthase (NADPH/NADH)